MTTEKRTGRNQGPIVEALEKPDKLRAAVSPQDIRSYDEKHADWVEQPSRQGGTWRQLSHALSGYVPELNNMLAVGQDRHKQRQLAEGRAKTLRGEVQDAEGRPLTLETIGSWKKSQGFFTGEGKHFIQGVESVLLENAGIEFDSHMQKFATESSLLSIKDPSERARILQEEATRYRQTLLERIGPDYENDYPLIDRFFNSIQMRTQDKLVGHLAAQQAKIHVEEGKQAFKERLYLVLGAGLSPEDTAQQFAGMRSLFASFGMSEPELNELLVSESMNFLKGLNIGPNDFQADTLIQALRMTPTGTGFLGQTAETTAHLQQLQDLADSKELRALEKAEKRIALQEKQELRAVQQGAASFLNTDNTATFQDFQEAHPELASSRFARDYFAKYQGFVSDSFDIAETPGNIALEEGLTIGLIRGTHTMDDVLAARSQLSRKQRKGLVEKAERMLTARDQIVRVVGASRFSEFQKNIETGQMAVLKGSMMPVTVEATALAIRKSMVAQNMAEAALYREVSRLMGNGVDMADIEKMLPDMLERISAPLMDPNNAQVTERAEEHMKGMNLSDSNPLIELFDMSYSRGKSPSYRAIPPRIGQYAEQAAQITGVPLSAILAVSWAESAYDEQARNTASTAYGPMQLLEGTAKDLGVDPKDAEQNILGGAKYLAQIAQAKGLDLRKPEDVATAYLFYHDGPGHQGPHRTAARGGAARVREALRHTTQVEQAVTQQRAAQQMTIEREQQVQMQAEQAAATQRAEEAARMEAEEAPYIAHLGATYFSLEGIAELIHALNSGLPAPILERIQEEIPDADMQVVERILARMWNERRTQSWEGDVTRAMQILQGPKEQSTPAEDLLEPFM